MKAIRCNDNCRYLTGNVNVDICKYHSDLNKGYDKYFCHNNKMLQTKIMGLDRWFHPLIQSKEIVIHAVENVAIFGTVVFWSDNKGYSYSYKDSRGQGTSGVYKSLIACVDALRP